jgi:quercetin dioxygenase-like cupin family protein
MTKWILWIASFAIVICPGIASQTTKPGLVRALSNVKFEADDDVACLLSATETGDPATGPSTIILKAAPKCAVRWHKHTAEEQLIVSQGSVLTEMEGMPAETLNAGGFALMPGKVKHRFSCQSKTECILFVTFDGKYDIVWVTDDSQPAKPPK